MNLWTLFQQATRQGGPLMIGEVVEIYNTFGDVQVDVQVLPGNAIIRAKAPGRSLEIGQRWVIQDGKVIDEAPSGTIFTAEV